MKRVNKTDRVKAMEELNSSINALGKSTQTLQQRRATHARMMLWKYQTEFVRIEKLVKKWAVKVRYYYNMEKRKAAKGKGTK